MDRRHSVNLIKDSCKGCTNCLKRCPTEAIRVRYGKAVILSGRCIDCGECIRVCPHHAKQAIFDTIDVLKAFDYTIALPAPSLYGQFSKLETIEALLGGLVELGFDRVYEVSLAAEAVSEATRKYIASSSCKKPVISSACPTITRLIQIRFPDLIDNILPLLTPAELAAMTAKRQAAEETGLPEDRIGAVFISPCPAKVSTVHNPIGIKKSNLDAAIAIKELYPLLLEVLKKNRGAAPAEIKQLSGSVGVGWGSSGGEAAATCEDRYLAADGIENCIRVLEKLEDGKIDVDFVELNACPGGCVGGVLTLENPFVAKARLKRLRQGLPLSCGVPESEPENVKWEQAIDYQPVMELAPDIASAMRKLAEMEKITAKLPGLDCGSCGAPSCAAFAEDIVKGEREMNECIFVLRESMQNIAGELVRLSTFNTQEEREKKESEENDGR